MPRKLPRRTRAQGFTRKAAASLLISACAAIDCAVVFHTVIAKRRVIVGGACVQRAPVASSRGRPRLAKMHSVPQRLEKLHPPLVFTRRLLMGTSVCGLAPGLLAAPSEGAPAAAPQLAGVGYDVLKSPNDQRLYRAVTLRNGLRVLLVSDPDATASGAALSIHAGSYSDPEDIPGVAHFCEHMLFLGNSAYPTEDELRRFLSAQGGSLNAFTTEQFTTYFFDVSPSGLLGALSRFSSLFKSPLFTASATDRELNAIESEDAKNKQSDQFRVTQVEKSFALQGHPERHFGTGNRATLAREDRDARSALQSFFQRYYHAGRSSSRSQSVWFLEFSFSFFVHAYQTPIQMLFRG